MPFTQPQLREYLEGMFMTGKDLYDMYRQEHFNLPTPILTDDWDDLEEHWQIIWNNLAEKLEKKT